ncbi:ABC transporter substrate-binding protein [Ruania alba]|uniref:ABC-type glycerol-3-phosphate transport system, substrate-binding protein n=1 Tax=Ruania alba TaxID=648782 RepID=A0A1H5KJX9_9MICO|nr:extracellular solute-binding protein [Ruania alba]SEE65095.1 ABC-type glycerol-3-phosphate transport system, substrate-binding protein [Ruania alba]
MHPIPSNNRRRHATWTALLLTGALTLAACGSGGESGGTSPSDDVELTFLNQSRGQEDALLELAAQYSEETGVTVTIDSPGPADFPARLQSMAQSGDMPDLYSVIDAFTMAPYYKADWAMDLAPELDGDWGESFDPVALELATYQEGNNLDIPAGLYSVHWDLTSYGLYVDPASTGIDPENAPQTVEDLIDTLESADSTGQFSIAASQVGHLMQTYASNFMTDQEIEATLNGEASWETDAWRSTFQLLVDLREAGVVANGSIPGGADDNPNVERAFFNSHTVGAIFDNTAAVAVAGTTAPDYTDYVTMGLSSAAEGTEPARAVVRLGKGAAVNPNGDHPDEALAFLQWLTAPEQQSVFANEVGVIPTNIEVVENGDMLAPMTGLAEGLSSAQTVRASFTPDVVAAIGAGAQSLMLGEVTVDELLADVQTAQEASA